MHLCLDISMQNIMLCNYPQEISFVANKKGEIYFEGEIRSYNVKEINNLKINSKKKPKKKCMPSRSLKSQLGIIP